jgi:two-component system CheB/CheR fusion protein
VVLVGGSAGGLEAFTQLLQNLPDNTGMAFVFIQHLDPRNASHLPEVLGRATPMEVSPAVEGMRVRPNQVYVMPPNADMTIADGSLHLAPRSDPGLPPHTINTFGESLATERGPRAIGVILSGTGSDGTLALKAIKSEGGITFTQDTVSARFGGMPQSAIASGAADFVLSPEEIGRRLVELGEHPYVNGDVAPGQAVRLPADNAEALGQITSLLKTAPASTSPPTSAPPSSAASSGA